MKKTDRKKLAGAGLYIALAACVLSAMTINVVSGIKNKNNSNEDFELSAVDLRAEGVTDSEASVLNQNANKNELSSGATTTTKDETAVNKTDVNESKNEPSDNAQNTSPDAETPDLTNDNEDQSAGVVGYSDFVMPVVGELGSYKGDSLVYSEVFGDYRIHEGIDITAKLGDSVMAFCDGTVTQVYDHALMGKTIVIDHGNGLVSVYKNLGEAVPEGIEAGASVKAGDVIGNVGSSALAKCANEAHLHFEVTYNEESVDPTQYFAESGK